jgi:hypothetical protein
MQRRARFDSILIVPLALKRERCCNRYDSAASLIARRQDIAAAHIAVGGDSAGGGLAIALINRLRNVMMRVRERDDRSADISC